MYTLNPAIRVGDFANPITVDQLEICRVMLDLEPALVSKGKATLSITLIHPASSWRMNVVYADATALTWWGQVCSGDIASMFSAIWEKLIADGKLPSGTATADVPAMTPAQAAATAAAAVSATPPLGAVTP